MFQTVNDSFVIGSVAEAQDLREVAAKGYHSVIDLCPAAEGNRLDGSMVEELGLAYASVPISMKNLTVDTLETFKQTLQNSPQPAYIRCASGLRASVFTLLAIADREGWNQEQYSQHFQALGIETKPNCPLSAFALTRFN